jgi:phosphoribosylformylglycinamidine synthase
MNHWVEVSHRPEFDLPLQLEGFSPIHRSRVYYLQAPDLQAVLSDLQKDSRSLADPVSEQIHVDTLAPFAHDWVVEVSYRGGVTDNEARVVEEVLPVQARSARRYYLRGGTADQIEALAARHWANLLIQRIQVVPAQQPLQGPPPVHLGEPPATRLIPLEGDLEQLSRDRLLALSGAEMETIARHFRALDRHPSEVELEALAQTWSEHCKHKIFNDSIEFEGQTVHSLFRTYIAGATAQCRRDWLVSVFTDNAGVIRWNERYHLVFKVETHNAPSALEPYGGALTGIVGVNRDPAGTGMGADLIFNTDVFCFAPLNTNLPLPPGLHSPRRLYEGVRQGVEDGGNQSGIPTVNGALFFDDRYLGRPLVFCGTGALMDVKTGHHKEIHPGDWIVMAGGRVGKDGIHGATFSSLAIGGGEVPVGVVQIGDPMTQKRLLEMLSEARSRGLYRALTDNGAGGLCSSVGELAQMSGGAHLHLDQVPLKYPGLAAWEILVSESQERMTLAVPPQHWEALQQLAQSRDVEVSAVGQFNDSGHFSASFHNQQVMHLPMDFLHGGLPKRTLPAHWSPPPPGPDCPPNPPLWTESLLQLLQSPNICSREGLIRQYDHEVQGSSVIKPLVGVQRDGPSDAAVLRPDHASDQGVAISCAINPHYGDHDPDRMAELLVDEAIRNAVAVGADPDHLALLDNFCWPDPVGDPFKMGQLVRCCRGLARAVVAFQAPLISGKDSMKNDYHGPQGKLSIPPTLLVSAIANVPNIHHSLSMDLKQPGDRVYLLGPEQSALAGSQYAHQLAFSGGRLGQLDYALAVRLYRALHQLIQQGCIASCHDCSEGGLAVALAEKAMAGRLGLRIQLPPSPLRLDERLFSEGPTRLLVSLDPAHQQALESALEGLPYQYLGQVIEEPVLQIGPEQLPLTALLEAWQGGLQL